MFAMNTGIWEELEDRYKCLFFCCTRTDSRESGEEKIWELLVKRYKTKQWFAVQGIKYEETGA